MTRHARPLLRLLGAAVAAVSFGAPAQAIVINDTAGLIAARELASPFDSVTEIIFRTSSTSGSLCSGALISTTTVLTADHCARGFSASQVTVNFTDTFGNTQISSGVSAMHFFGDPSTGADLLNGSDLAILTLNAPVTTRLPFLLYDGSVVGDLGRFVGYGQSGVGSTGSASGTAGGPRRAAENVIDFYGVAKNCGGPQGFCNRAGTTNILSADFDNPEGKSNTLSGNVVGSSSFMTTYEGTTAPGDSGGPILVLRDDVWLIAGVTSAGSSANSVYGDLAWWTGVASPAARSFVETYNGMYWTEFSVEPEPDPDAPAVIPVPAGGPLLLAALAGLAVLRRRAA